MQTALRNEATIERNDSTTHETTLQLARLDARDQQGLWQRFVSALFQARMRSAQREIERHHDWILFWRRGLGERGAHLRPVANDRAEVSIHAVAYHSRAQAFLASSAEVGRPFMHLRPMLERWRKRVRVRRQLLALSDSDLHDIRWTRAEVEAEGRKPFWRPTSLQSTPVISIYDLHRGTDLSSLPVHNVQDPLQLWGRRSMTSEIFSSPFVASFQEQNESVQEERRLSLWGRLVNAIMISRQQKAEEFMREYLRRHPEYVE